MGDLGNSMDTPYEPVDRTPLHDAADAIWSGGVVVMGAVIDVPDAGLKPALVFRFVKVDGEFHPPIVLVQDDNQMAKLRPLILAAVATARRAAHVGAQPGGP